MARRADPRLRHWWRELLETFDSTQETVGDFCGRHGISRSSFHRWRGKLSTPAAGGRSSGRPGQATAARSVAASPPTAAAHSGAFIPVNVVPAENTRWQSVQVHLSGGVSIEVPVEQKELLFDLVARVREPGSFQKTEDAS